MIVGENTERLLVLKVETFIKIIQNIWQEDSCEKRKLTHPQRKLEPKTKNNILFSVKRNKFFSGKRRFLCQKIFGSFLALFLHSFRWWKPGKDKNIAGYVYRILHCSNIWYLCPFIMNLIHWLPLCFIFHVMLNLVTKNLSLFVPCLCWEIFYLLPDYSWWNDNDWVILVCLALATICDVKQERDLVREDQIILLLTD